MIGKTISHYKIIEKLGEGGMGVVYKAEDLKLGRMVALKFLPPEWTRNAAARARFFHEAQAAAALSHPNICTVFEIDEADGQIFIAMERIEGERLRDMIARGPMEVGEVLDVSSQIAEGLAAAHAKGIVHRDIKPGNVMLAPGGRPKIMDFGLAKSAGQTKLTRTGTTTGTVAYMSPEQSRGQDVDHRTDIWSFGAMLYKMLTGRRPFRGDRDQAVIHSILNDEPDPITGLRTGVPIELERIVRKAMAKRADERYQHVDDLIADLRSLRRELDSGTATVSVPAAAPAKKRSGAAVVWRWAIVAAVVVIALTMVWRVTHHRTAPADLDPRKIVVAVFENRTGDASLDPIGQMVADAIAEGLAQIGVIEVVPALIAGEPESRGEHNLMSLAETSGAALIISGAYYLASDSLRFQASLTDAQKGKVVVTIPAIGGHRGNPIGAIERLRQRAMGAVAFYVEPGLVKGEVVSPPTYDAYREYSFGVRLFGSDYPAAIEHFERAAALDTTFTAPWLYIYFCHANRGEYARADSLVRSLNGRRERLSPYEGMFVNYMSARNRGNNAEQLRVLRLMQEAAPDDDVVNYLIAVQSLALNRPKEAVAAFSATHYELRDSAFYARSWGFATLGMALHLLGEYEEELEILRRAREIYPDIFWLRANEARALVALGRLDDVEALINETLAASGSFGTPAGVMSHASLALRVHIGREEAIQMAERAVAWRRDELEGKTVADDWWGHSYMAGDLYAAERWQEAQGLFLQLASERPEDLEVKGYLGVLAARLGEHDEARATLEDLRRLDRPYLFGNNTYWAACIAAQLGERERAVELIRQALAQGFRVDMQLHTDMDLEPLHGYPPFEELRRPKG
jgi:tetratricopeptide (TPR) repeat protein/predicted Ser/Thr protein kinase